MRILVTGGAGFIGSNFLHYVVPRHPDCTFINVDKLTYAGHRANVEGLGKSENYRFQRLDLADGEAVRDLVRQYSPEGVIHFAAETHVDRSLDSPAPFIWSNVMGTFNLLEACRQQWDGSGEERFHHVSTDEVYGELGEEGVFTEETAYDPSSPYAASKASSDHLVRAYGRSYDLPVTLTNSSNNYGPRQHPEKLVPLMILNALEGEKLPVYGDGRNVRDWLYVEDHCRAVWRVFTDGRDGETYNVGGSCEKSNLDVVGEICAVVAEFCDRCPAELRELIEFVPDRPGHDFRYAMDTEKIRAELGWSPAQSFSEGLHKTVEWYLKHPEWIERMRPVRRPANPPVRDRSKRRGRSTP